jgi:hypothetical protein
VRVAPGGEPVSEDDKETEMTSISTPKHLLLVTFLALGFVDLAAAQSQQDPRLAQLADAEGCEFPEIPSIPNAESATMEQMVATQGAIQAYIEASNMLLECLEGISGNEELPVEDRQLALGAYNAEVENQETAAESWNVQRTRFLEMQQ